MGGPMSVNDDIEWIGKEVDIIQRAVEAGLPVLGHCLGGQLISKALGGKITANPVKEIGWLTVQKTPNPEADDWLSGFEDHSSLFHWHGETFSIPQGATNILRSEHCDHQGFVIGKTLALQCHVEMTEAMVREWADLYTDELSDPAATVQDHAEITENLKEKTEQLQRVADQLYRRWLQPWIAAK
jgi:GMP synthase-like glutamine amidotransferase